MAERRAGEQKSASMRVKLKYPNVDTFLQKYGPNISRGGVFIATKMPRPVGTKIRFDFVLLHDDVEESVLRGEGTVDFVRENDADGKKSGMGVLFTRLLDDGEALIERALQMRPRAPEPQRTPGLPQGVREITGEFEMITGPVAKLEPDPPPASDGSTDALDALVAESGVSPDRVEAVLRRRWDDRTSPDELLRPAPPSETSAAEASARIDELLGHANRRRG